MESKKLCVVSVCRQGLRAVKSCVVSVCRQGLRAVRSCVLCRYVDRNLGQ